MNSNEDHKLNKSLGEAYQQVQEKWTDVFTGDSDANRARRGEGAAPSGYDKNTGTSRRSVGRSGGTMTSTPGLVFARKNGKAGFMKPGQPDSWARAGDPGSKATQSAARRHDTIARDNVNQVKSARSGTGGGQRGASPDTSYNRNTGTSTAVNKDGKTDQRIFARKDGKAGYMVKGKPGSWESAPSNTLATRQAARRHDQIQKGRNSQTAVTAMNKPAGTGSGTKPPTSGTGTVPPKPSTSGTTPPPAGGTRPPTRGTRPPAGGTRPSSGGSRPSPTATASKAPTSKSSAMQQWAKNFPQLASKVKPGQSGYNAIQSSKPTPKPTPSLNNTSKPTVKPQTGSIATPTTPKPAPTMKGISSPRLAAALSSVKPRSTMKSEGTQWINEMYSEEYKEFPKHKVQDKAAMKPDTARGESQARKMDTVRKATKAFPGEVEDMVRSVSRDNKARGLEKRFNAPSADNASEKKRKSKAYKLENQRRKDLDKRYGPKKEELEASGLFSEEEIEVILEALLEKI